MSTREQHEHVMALFDALCDLSEAAREPRLAALAATDARLAEELRTLLAHDSPTPGRLQQAATAAAQLARSLAPPPPLQRTTTTSTRAGQLVNGRWRLDRLLGAGGSGEVHIARLLTQGDREADPSVAIKFLRADLPPLAERRFRREFLAVSRLRHPGCVRVFAEGVHTDGARYFVMEYLPGGDLTRMIGAATPVLVEVLLQICAALDYIHGLGIVHRDLKPGNVLLDHADPPRVVLADFGIAKAYDEALSSLSERGLLHGTIDFVSPEQVQGRPVQATSDLYSLGCLMFTLWSGAPPFLGSSFERLVARVDGEAPHLDAAPPAIARVVAALLLRDPARRPQSANAVAEMLAQW